MAGRKAKTGLKPLARGKRHIAQKENTVTRNRFKFKNFGDQVESITFERIQRFGSAQDKTLGPLLVKPTDNQSWFEQALVEWRELNCTKPFAIFVGEVWSLSGSLTQVLFHRQEIVELLVKHMEQSESELAAAPFSALTAALVRDLGEELVIHFPKLFSALISILGRVKDVESLEVVLGSIFYFVKALLSDLPPQLVVDELLIALQTELRPQVQDFLAEFASHVIGREFEKDFVSRIVLDLGQEKFQELSGCILAGSIEGSKKTLTTERAQRLQIVIDSIAKHTDSTKLFQKVILALIDRMTPSKAWEILIDAIPQINLPLNLDLVLSTIFNLANLKQARRLFSDQTLDLLSVLASIKVKLQDTTALQNAILSILTFSDLKDVLPLRQTLGSIFADARGVSLLCHKNGSLLEPLVGIVAGAKLIFEQVYPTNKLGGITLLQTLISKSCAENSIMLSQVVAQLPIDDLIDNLQRTDYRLVRASLALLSNLSSITDDHRIDSWVELLCEACPSHFNCDQWMDLLHVARRFIKNLNVTNLASQISDIRILDLLLSLPKVAPPPFLLKPLLLSSNHERRLMALNLLARTTSVFSNSPAFDACLSMEGIPWTFNCDREKGIYLQDISNRLQSSQDGESDEKVEVIIRTLVGMSLAGFAPLQNQIFTALSLITDTNCDQVRRVMSETLNQLTIFEGGASTSQTAVIGDELDKEEDMFSLVDSIILLQSQTPPAKTTISHDPFFGRTSLSSFLQFLAYKPSISSLLATELLPLTLTIFGSHSLGGEGQVVVTRWFEKQMQGSLPELLTAMTSWSLTKNDKSKLVAVSEILHRLLATGEVKLQRRALEAILALSIYENGSLRLVIDRLYRLLDEKEVRDELVLMATEKWDSKTWEETLCPLLIRLLYGRMTCRRGKTAGRNQSEILQKIILNYVSTWDESSFHEFLLFWASESIDSLNFNRCLSFLNVLSTVFKIIGKKIGKKTVDFLMGWFEKLYQSADQLLTDASSKANKENDTLQRVVLKRLQELFMIVPITVDMSGWLEKSWDLIIKPKISRLEQGLVQEDSIVLDLVNFWISETRFRSVILTFEAVDIWSRLAVLPAIPTSLHTITACALGIWETFVKLASQDEAAKKILLTVVEPLSVSLERIIDLIVDSKEKLYQQKVLLDRIVELLLELSPYISCQESRASLTASLLKLLPLKRPESSTRQMINLATTLYVPEANQDDLIYKVSCKLLSSLKERESRAALANLFAQLSKVDQSLLFISTILADLHAPSLERPGEYDYDRQTLGFSTLRTKVDSLPKSLWPPILHALFFFCQDAEDTAARTHSFSIIGSFIQHVQTQKEDDGDWMEILLSNIYPAVKKGLRNASETVRYDFLLLLNTLATILCDSAPFNSLVPLLAAGNDEANVLLNLLHLQQHRRLRALRRLCEFTLSEAGAKMPRMIIEDFLIPLLSHFIMFDPTKNNPVPDQVVYDATITLAALYSRLTTKRIISRMTYFGKLLTQGRGGGGGGVPFEKSLLRLIPAILRYRSRSSFNEKQGRYLLKLLFELFVDLKNPRGRVRASIAISIAELLPHLPPDAATTSVPKLLTNLTILLTHKYEESRKEARDAIAKVLECLGPSYLSLVIRELRNTLVSGVHKHILSYTVHHLLVTTGFFAKPQPEILDQVITEIIPIVIGDIFGAQSLEKRETEWTGRIEEVRSQKSPDTLARVVAAVSIDCLIKDILKPIKLAVSKATNSKSVETACRALESGLIERSDYDDLCPLLYSLVNEESPFFTDFSSFTKDDLKTTKSSCDFHWNLHMVHFQIVGARTLLHLVRKKTIPMTVINQFIPHLATQVLTGKSTNLTTASIHILCKVIGAEASTLLTLPALDTELLQRILRSLFDLVFQSDSRRHLELLRAAFKLISTLIKERHDVQLDETQMRALLDYICTNLESESNASIAFELVKVILDRKIILPEVYSLGTILCRTILRSFHSSVRQNCQKTFLTFLLDYPLARNRLDSHLSFITANLSYEADGGRESIVTFLGLLVGRLPLELIQDMAETWLVALTARLANETKPSIQRALKKTLGKIIARIDTRTMDRFTVLIEKWLMAATIAVQKAAWTAAALVITEAIIPITNLANILINRMIENNIMEAPFVEALDVAAAIISKCPTAAAMTQVELLMNVSLKKENLSLIIQRNRLVGEYLFQLGDSLSAIPGYTIEMRKMTFWLRSWFGDLKLLKSDMVEGEAAEQIVKNILFVTRLLKSFPITTTISTDDDDSYREEEAYVVSVEDLLGKIERLFKQLPSNNGSASLFVSAILKLMAALVVWIDDDSLTNTFSTPILAVTIGILEAGSRGGSTTNNNQKYPESDLLMAQQVTELISHRLGKKRYEDLKIQVIQSLSSLKRRNREGDAAAATASGLTTSDPQAFSRRRLERAKRFRTSNYGKR